MRSFFYAIIESYRDAFKTGEKAARVIYNPPVIATFSMILLVLAALASVCGIVKLGSDLVFVRNATQTTGVITRFAEDRNQKSPNCLGTVEFATASQIVVSFQGVYIYGGVCPVPGYELGQTVSVLYQPNSPSEAVVGNASSILGAALRGNVFLWVFAIAAAFTLRTSLKQLS